MAPAPTPAAAALASARANTARAAAVNVTITSAKPFSFNSCSKSAAPEQANSPPAGAPQGVTLSAVVAPSAKEDKTAAPPANSEDSDKAGHGAKDGIDKDDLMYTVRPGDTLSSIGGLFRVPTAELLRTNDVGTDGMVRIGSVLRIPNPYASRVGALEAQVAKLNHRLGATNTKLATAQSDVRLLHGQLDGLAVYNQRLEREVRNPWWRSVAIASGAAGVLMLAVAAIALFDWFLTRRRFRALAEMNESLRRLDRKYKATVAKAELRLQQLYGRRRQGMAVDQELIKIPEDDEMERLDDELRKALEKYIERLGPASNGVRRLHQRLLRGHFGSPVTAPR